MRIAVLMACHNRKEKTLNCLRFLFEQQGLSKDFKIQVFLLDDTSTDGTVGAVSRNFPAVKIINGNGNLYWNRGMYTAWKAASEEIWDHYLWLNDDTYLYKGAILELITAAQQTFNKAIICGCTESPVQKGELTYGGGSHQGNNYIPNYPNGQINRCDIINGNCVLVPESAFRKVGNLDWNFSHGIGDNDYSLRAKKKGVPTFTTASFIGVCQRNESTPKWCLPKVKFSDRIKNLYSPLGNPPFEYFIFEKRHFGFLTAFKHYFTTHLRVFFPKLWK